MNADVKVGTYFSVMNSSGVVKIRIIYGLIFLGSMMVSISGMAYENYALKSSSYIGSDGSSELVDIATDAQNNVYVTGVVNGMSVVRKISPTNTILYTFSLESGTINAIDIDSSGRVYLVGAHGGVGTPPICADWGHFVARISADGSHLDYCKLYLPDGDTGDPPTDLTLDQNGDVYVTGEYGGHPITVTDGVFQSTPANIDDGYVVKISSDGTQILTAFYLGGNGIDEPTGIKVGSDGTIFIVGSTTSTDFPSANTGSGDYDIFFAKITNDGSSVLFSQLYGGSQLDVAVGVSIDLNDNAYIVGSTASNDIPVTAGALQTTLNDTVNGIIMKIGTDHVVNFLTYYGVFSNIQAMDIDAAGNVFVTGIVGSPEFITTPNAYQEISPPAVRAAYLSKISADGTQLLYSTFLAGHIDYNGFSGTLNGGFAVKALANSNVAMSGPTSASNFPVTQGALNNTLIGLSDNFLSIFELSSLDLTSPPILDPITVNTHYDHTFSVLGGINPYEWFIEPTTLPNGLMFSTDGVLSGEVLYPFFSNMHYHYVGTSPITFQPFRVGVRDQSGDVFYKEYLARVNYLPEADAGPGIVTAPGTVIMLNGSGSIDNEGGIVNYSWTQLSGQSVTIMDDNSMMASFVLPNYNCYLVFQLTVTDTDGFTDTDTVTVSTGDLNPDCSNGSGSAGSSGSGSGGGGCMYNPRAQFDPMFLLFILLSFVYLGRRYYQTTINR